MPRIRPLALSVAWRMAAAHPAPLAGPCGQGAWSGPARSYASAMMRCWPGTTQRADPCRAPGVENRHCGTRSPCALRRRTGRRRRLVRLRAPAPGRGGSRRRPDGEAAVADLRDALEPLLAEVGPPDELTLTPDVA